MDTIECIMSRRSIRKYTHEEIPEEELKIILECAMQAPSAVNEQPWDFIVVRDKELLKKIPSVSPYASMVSSAPIAIIVCADSKKEHLFLKGFGIQDASIAAQNILLAAHALGLGAVWTAVHPDENRIKGIRQLFHIPEHVTPLCIIPIGFPNENKKPERRFKKERVHEEKW